MVYGALAGGALLCMDKAEAQCPPQLLPVNVKDKLYGATGNGVTDDTAAINAAIAAVPSGGTLIFPCGTYNFTGLTLTTPINIVGQGAICTILNYTPATGTAITWNTGPHRQGMFSIALAGPVTNIANGLTSTTIGLFLGGTTGVAYCTFRDFDVTGFGTGVKFGNNTYFVTFDAFGLGQNYVNMNFPSVTNSGENIRFINGYFGFSGEQYTGGLYGASVQIAGAIEMETFGCSFDCTRVDVAASAGAKLKLVDSHFEWPNGGNRAVQYITCADNGTMITILGATALSLGTTSGPGATSFFQGSAGTYFVFHLDPFCAAAAAIVAAFSLTGTASLYLFASPTLGSFSNMTSGYVSSTSSGSVIVQDGGGLKTSVPQQAYVTNGATASLTLPTTNVYNGSVEQTLNLTGAITTAQNAQMPTVASIIAAAFPYGFVPGQAYKLRIINSGGTAAGVWTITTNTGWTLNGTTMNIPIAAAGVNNFRDFYVTFASATAATLQAVDGK